MSPLALGTSVWFYRGGTRHTGFIVAVRAEEVRVCIEGRRDVWMPVANARPVHPPAREHGASGSFPAEVVSSKSPTPSREDGAPARAPSSLSAIAQMLVSTIMVGWALLSLQGQSPVALFRSGSFDDPALGWFAVVATTTPVAVALLWRALSGCTEAKMLRVFYVAEGAGGLIAAFLIGVFSVLRQ